MKRIEKAEALVRQSIERIEFDYLKAIGEGPGWPAFFICDLLDPFALVQARKAFPHADLDAHMSESRARGVHPLFVGMVVLVNSYETSPGWWDQCPDHRFPIAVLTDGDMTVFSRPQPDGINEALARCLLVRRAESVIETYHLSKDAGLPNVAVIVADPSDPLGREAAILGVGQAKVDEVLAQTTNDRRSTLIWSGETTSESYPDAWGGPLPPGRFAVQVVANGLVLNMTMADPLYVEG
jgi:hypothetical protein